MKIYDETVLYYIEDAMQEINKIILKAKNKSLKEEDIVPWMEHALEMFNCAFNCRNKSRENISKMSQIEWEKYLFPPKEIFEVGQGHKNKKVNSQSPRKTKQMGHKQSAQYKK